MAAEPTVGNPAEAEAAPAEASPGKPKVEADGHRARPPPSQRVALPRLLGAGRRCLPVLAPAGLPVGPSFLPEFGGGGDAIQREPRRGEAGDNAGLRRLEAAEHRPQVGLHVIEDQGRRRGFAHVDQPPGHAVKVLSQLLHVAPQRGDPVLGVVEPGLGFVDHDVPDGRIQGLEGADGGLGIDAMESNGGEAH
jgi:hypothetical protein